MAVFPAKSLLAVVVAGAFLPGCMKAARDAPEAQSAGMGAPEQAEGGVATDRAVPAAGALAQASAKAAAAGEAAAPGLEAAFASLKLIRTAQIALEVPRYDSAAEEVARVARALGGYVAEAQASRGAQERQAGTMTVRVPAERFGEALAALKGVGRVRSENVSTQDVTKAYSDLETRLKVKRDTAGRLRELLRVRTAGLADVLSAEHELARVTEEIERMEGERRFYDRQVAFSTIALSLAEPQALVEPSVFAPITEALRDSVHVMARSLAALVYVLVFLAPWALLALAAWKAVKALRARRKAHVSASA